MSRCESDLLIGIECGEPAELTVELSEVAREQQHLLLRDPRYTMRVCAECAEWVESDGWGVTE